MGVSLAHGAKVLISDGGSTNGTKASKTIGTSDQQLKILAKKAGTAGNSKTFGITVSGNNTAFGITVSASAVMITSATDGSGVATTTVLEAIAALYANETFQANFDATVGTGDGSGILVAGASGALSGGAAGAEVLTEIAFIHEGLAGLDSNPEIQEAKTHDADYVHRKARIKNFSALTFGVLYDSSNASHALMDAAAASLDTTRFVVRLNDTGKKQYEFNAFVKSGMGAPVDGFNTRSYELTPEGDVTEDNWV